MNIFWLDDPKVLYYHRTEIIPLISRTIPRNLNSLVRFCIILGIVLAVYKENLGFTLIGGLGMVVSIILYYSLVGVIQLENFEVKCQHPSPSNPLMNVLYGDPVDRLPACDANDPIIIKEIEEATKKAFNLPVDVSDVFNYEQKYLNNYTNPSTTVGGEERQNYLDFISKGYKKTACKEDSKFCKIYEDLRQYSRN